MKTMALNYYDWPLESAIEVRASSRLWQRALKPEGLHTPHACLDTRPRPQAFVWLGGCAEPKHPTAPTPFTLPCPAPHATPLLSNLPPPRLKACRDVDAAVVFVGGSMVWTPSPPAGRFLEAWKPVSEGEGFDRRSLNLPGQQLDLLKALVRRNPSVPLVVVALHGGPLDLAWAQGSRSVPGLVAAGYPGQVRAAFLGARCSSVAGFCRALSHPCACTRCRNIRLKFCLRRRAKIMPFRGPISSDGAPVPPDAASLTPPGPRPPARPPACRRAAARSQTSFLAASPPAADSPTPGTTRTTQRPLPWATCACGRTPGATPAGARGGARRPRPPGPRGGRQRAHARG
jgi:hypothetical protein